MKVGRIGVTAEIINVFIGEWEWESEKSAYLYGPALGCQLLANFSGAKLSSN